MHGIGKNQDEYTVSKQARGSRVKQRTSKTGFWNTRPRYSDSCTISGYPSITIRQKETSE